MTLVNGPSCTSHHGGQPFLESFFTPGSIALIGASETAGSVGRMLLENLKQQPHASFYAVNPNRSTLLGLKAFSSIQELPKPIDLAVIATPAPTVPEIIRECVQSRVGAAIIISAGFREAGAAGAALEAEIREAIEGSNLRVIGPNCFGVMRPSSGLNATFAGAMVPNGSVGFASQSGALLAAILDWSLQENVGFSTFISMGSMLDVDWGDVIEYLGEDAQTHSIVLYIESIGNARKFISAARAVALQKPIVVIKAGRTAAAAKAAASHTGSLTGSDDVLDALFRRCGVLRVERIADLFYLAEILAKQPRPRGPRLLILGNAGGPGVLATDALISGGGQLAELSEATIAQLDAILPPHWSHNNPIDILGDANATRYARAVDVAIRDPNADGLLVILTPQAMSDPTQTAEAIAPLARAHGKPMLASWMGAASIKAGEALLNRAGIPTFPYPDSAARAFQYLWQYSDNLNALYETPVLPSGHDEPDRPAARAIIDAARCAERVLLTEFESKRLLSAYGLPTVETRLAADAEGAMRIATEIGYPVVLKLNSETITHKTDVGGVQLNLQNAYEVRRAFIEIQSNVAERVGSQHFAGVAVQPMVSLDGYEVIIGSSVDSQVGPVLMFGAGGQLVEVFKDHALGLPPLTSTLARRMMEQTRIFTALQGVRGRRPVNIEDLALLLVRFSQLVVDHPRICEIDINPLLASPDRLLILDARVAIFGNNVSEVELPQPAIRPYPTQYRLPWQTKAGLPISIRPIRPEDEPRMVDFYQTLSDETVYLRYFHPYKLNERTAHQRMIRMCFINYDREMALVALMHAADGADKIIAVGRLIKRTGMQDAEFAIVVSDLYQNQGIGTELLNRLVQFGCDEKLQRITAVMLPGNLAMRRASEKAGFTVRICPSGRAMHAELDVLS